MAIISNTAFAGQYADQLSQCLISHSNEQDRSELAKWIFSVIAQHPDIKEYTNLTDEQQKTIGKTAANIFQRLMTKDCKEEFASVITHERNQGVFIAFKTLGEVSMNTLISNPVVQKATSNFTEYLDTKAIQETIEQTQKKQAE